MRRVGLYALIAFVALALVGVLAAGVGGALDRGNDKVSQANTPTVAAPPAPETAPEETEEEKTEKEQQEVAEEQPAQQQAVEQAVQEERWREIAEQRDAEERAAAERRAAGFHPDDIDAALEDMHESFDIARDDLHALLARAELHAQRRQRG